MKNIIKHINDWGKIPLYTRKDNNIEALLDINNRDTIITKRLIKCMESKNIIDDIVWEKNFALFFNINIDSCPCSSGEDDNDSDDMDEEKSVRSVLDEFNEGPRKCSMRTQSSMTEDLNLIAKLRRPRKIKFDKTAEQMALYRPYEEYIDDLVANAVMAAILTRSLNFFKYFIINVSITVDL